MATSGNVSCHLCSAEVAADDAIIERACGGPGGPQVTVSCSYDCWLAQWREREGAEPSQGMKDAMRWLMGE